MSLLSIHSVAITSFVYPTAFITKMLPATASHVVTTVTFLDPNRALWTLFQFFANQKLLECQVIFVRILHLVLSAVFSNMKFASTIETIVFAATRTTKFIILLIKHKCILASRCRAPTQIFLLIDHRVQTPVLVFLVSSLV